MNPQEIDQILAEVAEDTSALAGRLYELEIRGRRHRKDETPLGLFLERVIPQSIVWITPSREHVVITHERVTLTRPLPETLRQFMALFDAGVLPSLERGLPSRFPTLFFQCRRLRLSPFRHDPD